MHECPNCQSDRTEMTYTASPHRQVRANLVTVLFTSVRIEADCIVWP